MKKTFCLLVIILFLFTPKEKAMAEEVILPPEEVHSYWLTELEEEYNPYYGKLITYSKTLYFDILGVDTPFKGVTVTMEAYCSMENGTPKTNLVSAWYKIHFPGLLDDIQNWEAGEIIYNSVTGATAYVRGIFNATVSILGIHTFYVDSHNVDMNIRCQNANTYELFNYNN